MIAIRGVIRYDYPGTSEVRSTTFHTLVLRNPDPTRPAGWSPIPTSDGVIPAGELFVDSLAGRTEAT